jgi:hypothetical protein
LARVYGTTTTPIKKFQNVGLFFSFSSIYRHCNIIDKVLLLWVKPGSKVWTFSRYFMSVLGDPNHIPSNHQPKLVRLAISCLRGCVCLVPRVTQHQAASYRCWHSLRCSSLLVCDTAANNRWSYNFYTFGSDCTHIVQSCGDDLLPCLIVD